MTNPKIKSREDLIFYISSHLVDIRKEAGISQADLSKILGISKNTIINAEKAEQTLSWPVVISIVTLFQQLQVIQEITKEENALALLSRCAFLHEESLAKNKLLHSTLLSTPLLAAMLPGMGIGLPILSTLNEVLKNTKKDD